MFHKDWYYFTMTDDRPNGYMVLLDIFHWLNLYVGDESKDWVWIYDLTNREHPFQFFIKDKDKAMFFKLVWIGQ